jgi:hypothetical protein
MILVSVVGLSLANPTSKYNIGKVTIPITIQSVVITERCERILVTTSLFFDITLKLIFI